MALITCPECGKEVSDKASQCIHCGYPLDFSKEQKSDNSEMISLWECNVCGYYHEGPEAPENCPICKVPRENFEIVDSVKKGTSKYKVLLIKCDDAIKLKINAIIRQETKLSVSQTKEIVDNCPKYIAENITKEKADLIVKRIQEAGAIALCEYMKETGGSNTVGSSSQNQKGSNLKNCPVCGEKISVTANSCPHCGHSFINQKQQQGMGFWGVVGAIIVAVLLISFF